MQNFFASRLHQFALVLGLSTFLVYSPSLWNEFVSLDDGLLITKNPAVQAFNWKTIQYVFTHYDPELYIPLTFLSYQLNHLLVGLHPFLYHLTNLLLHTGSAVLVLFVLYRLVGSFWMATVGALLFAIHPLQTEAVAWAAARKDVLSGFFFLLSVLLYIRFRDQGSRAQYWISIFAFALGLLAKVSIITLPLVLLLIDWFHRRPWSLQMLREKVPYLLLAALFGIIAVIGKTQVLQSSGLELNILLASKSTMFYLWKMLVPWGLSVIYPQAFPVSVVQLDILVPLLLTGILSLITVLLLIQQRFRLAAFALAFFLLLLVPNYTNFYKNGFLFFGSDRYAYLASIGIFLLVGFLIEKLARRSSALACASMVVLVIPLAMLTVRQEATWKTSETLYRNVVRFYPEAAIAHNNLGDVLMKAGRAEEAREFFQKALMLDPHMMSAHLNMGEYYRGKADFERALPELQAAVAVMDRKPGILSLDEVAAYYYLGRLLEQMSRTEEALEQFRKAVTRAPDQAEPHYNYGVTLQKFGRNDEALEQFSKAVQLDPLYIAAQYHLAGLLAERGKLPEAIAALEQVIAIDPSYEKAAEHLRAMRTMVR